MCVCVTNQIGIDDFYLKFVEIFSSATYGVDSAVGSVGRRGGGRHETLARSQQLV